MIFFPIIWASLFIALPRIISAAPYWTYNDPSVIDNNPSVGRSVEISPPLHHEISPPLPTRHEIAWNEGEIKPIVEEKGQADHIERTQDFNNNNNNQPPE